MSPLKIEALLRLYYTPEPFQGYSPARALSYSMVQAYEDFKADGLLSIGVNLDSAIEGLLPYPALTAKGLDVVRRLCEVEP